MGQMDKATNKTKPNKPQANPTKRETHTHKPKNKTL